jgi:hypothetical protein
MADARESERHRASYEAGASTRQEGEGPGVETRGRNQRVEERADPEEGDVVLRVPRLDIDEVNVEVGRLKAPLSLQARLAGLLRLDAGVDINLEDVNTYIKGVEAEAHLRVYLQEVARIIDRTLSVIEKEPDAVTKLVRESTSQPLAVDDEERQGMIGRILPGGGDKEK